MRLQSYYRSLLYRVGYKQTLNGELWPTPKRFNVEWGARFVQNLLVLLPEVSTCRLCLPFDVCRLNCREADSVPSHFFLQQTDA